MRLEEMDKAGEATFPLLSGFAGIGEPSAQFLENLPFAIYACDADGRISWFDSRAAELWGRQPRVADDSEKYCGSYRRYFGGRSISRDETPMASVLRTGIPIRGATGRVERPDGSAIWVTVFIEPIEDAGGNIVGAINCFHETSALAPVRDQERALAATVEHAGIGLADVSAEGKLLRVNPHLAALLGYAPDELLGRSIFDADLTDGSEADEAQFHRQVRGEIDRYSTEKQFRRRDGSKRWASITSVSVRDSEGQFLYAVRAQRDVSAQKAAEEALARRAEEQAALYEFTAALQHVGEPDDLYAQAMAAIFRALGCDRASILLADESGVLRFVAAKGLSATYRRAVEGHSPWPADTANPALISIDDVESSDLAEAVKAAMRAEGIGALAFIPIVANDRLLGKFMTYYDRRHVFAEAEKNIALTIARQLGLAVETMRNEAARMRAEKAAQQLVAVVESSHDAIVSKDLNGVIITWNRGAERLFGYTAAEAVGRPITLIIPPDRLAEEPKILARIRRGELVDHFETVRRRKDGTLVDISLTISPVRDAFGRVVGASKIARDITERKEVEANLQEHERHLRELLAAIPAAIYTTDAQGKITYYNEEAVELAGRRPRIGSDEWCVTWKLFRPDGTPMPHDECPMAVVLKEGRAIRNAEAIAERPDGTRVPFIPYPTPLRDANGKVVGAINMLVDVSERKQAETQQRILFNELNHRVKNNMQMLQSLLNMSSRQTVNAEARRILGDAGGRVAAMAAAQQVLYGTNDASHFKAQEFLDAVCLAARQAFAGEADIVCSAGTIELSTDTAMPLALIVNELLTNAMKHGANGNERPSIRVGLSRQHDSFVLYVEDDGPGFDLKAVRPQSSGLKLVQGLARQLGGTLEVTKEPVTRCSVQFT
jgi:PAS domain S-box-containing protein